jgi:DNA invertase Pin-like site-specific DNA recombinase
MYYIYQRISTEKQSLLRQEGAIADYCKANNIEVPEENIFSDVITGKTIKRENYQQMKAKLKNGDVLLLLDLDRLGRSWDIIKKEWQELTDMGVYITVVNCPIINVMPDENGNVSLDKRLIQSIMFELLCYLSQKEVEKISRRTSESLRAKQKAGMRLGAPPKLSDEQRAEILALKGIKTCKEIGEMYGVNASTISRIK